MRIYLLKQYPRKRVEKFGHNGIYRDTTELLNSLYRLVQAFPRFFKYGLGVRMTELCLNMLALIFKANSSYEKSVHLNVFLADYQMLKTLFRVCVDQKIMSPKQYAHYALLMDRIGKQATAWRNYSENAKAKSGK